MPDYFQCLKRPSEVNTILIIDDDEINRGILGHLFADSYTIQEAENGKEGLEAVLQNQQRICAILLDVIMPEMSGLEVLGRLKEAGIIERIPVFLITSEVDAAIKQGYELGAMDVISKPIVPYLVLRRVNSVIELFEARRRLEHRVEQQEEELLAKTKQILELNQGMIESLSTAIEFRNEESGDHVRRIHDITALLLSQTDFCPGLTDEEIENIALASVMHDVGKIAIPDSILGKPGKLTPEEFEIMKTHTTQGGDLLEHIPQLQHHGAYRYAWDIARHHHERWDGNGYPDGLKGDEITPWAQVVSIVDVYDALNCKRVYKDAFPHEKVLEMIRTGQCGVFNPKLLECFFKIAPQLAPLYETWEKEN
ncbi:MAG: response regulator [Clostridiales bacterium]|nr:response regulator [Clostridiales bacterium]